MKTDVYTTNCNTYDDYDALKELNLFPIYPMFNGFSAPIVHRDDVNNIMRDDLNNLKNGGTYHYTYRDEKGKIHRDGVRSSKDITGYCLRLGEPSGVMVIDLDVGDGHNTDFNGIDEFEKAFGHPYTYFNTLKVKSPSGGVHMYFKYDPDLPDTITNILPNVDFLSNGYNTPVPGSYRGFNNKKPEKPAGTYEIEGRYTEVTAVPKDLLDKIKALYKKKSGGKKTEKAVSKDPVVFGPNSIPEGKRHSFLISQSTDNPAENNIHKFLNPMKYPEYFKGLMYTYLDSVFVEPMNRAEIDATIQGCLNYRSGPVSDKGYVDFYKLAEAYLSSVPAFQLGHDFYIYDVSKGAYTKKSDKDIFKIYFKLLNEYPHVRGSEYEACKADKFLKQIDYVIESLDKQSTKDMKKYVSCLNWIYLIHENKFVRHNPKYRNTCQIQADYDKDWRDKFKGSQFNQFLRTITKKCKNPETMILLIQEMFALALSPHATEVQKAFVLLGEGSNGKSVIFAVLSALVGGPEFVSTLGLERMQNDGFSLGELEGKAVNIDPDSHFHKDFFEGSAKSVIAGDEIRIDRKYKDTQTLNINITTITGMNRLPAPPEKSQGVYRRLAIIPMKTKFGTPAEMKAGKADLIADNSLIEKLTSPEEMNIIFSWAIEGLRRLYKNDWVLSESEDSQSMIETYRYESDSATQFYEERLTKVDDNNQRVMVSKLYVSYVNFCEDYKIKPQSKNSFGSAISAQGIEKKKYNKGMFWIGLTECPPEADPDDPNDPDNNIEALLDSDDDPFQKPIFKSKISL